MRNKALSAILAITLAGVATNGYTDDGEEEESERQEKVVLCHKNEKSIRVGAPGLLAHLAHGDTEGYCENDENNEESDFDNAVVIMHCEGEQVTSLSSSVEFPEPPLSEIGTGSECASSLASFLDSGFDIEAVTGNTDYLLVAD